MEVKKFICNYWKFLLTWIVPFVFLPLIFAGDTQTRRCGYMLLVMAVYWMTECIPLGVTGLIPLVLAPVLGILTLKETCTHYMSDTVMFFTGAIVIALAIERCNLHKRIALNVLLRIGVNFKWLLFGITMTTCAVSVFITNTATAAMMLPIVNAILEQLGEIKSQPAVSTNHSKEDLNEEGIALFESDKQGTDQKEGHPGLNRSMDKAERDLYVKFTKCLTLVCTYAAQCGGTAALTGCSTNVIMKGYADQLWRKHGYEESPVTYASWLMYGVPVSLTNIVIIWIWITFHSIGFKAFLCKSNSESEELFQSRVYQFIKGEKRCLGSVRFSEYLVILLFSILVLLWFFRAPGFMDGWATLFQKGYVGGATPTILVAILLFAIPKEVKATGGTSGSTAMMTWETVHTKLPWSLVFLMGGGFALAEACNRSGLSAWMGSQLSFLMGLNLWLLVFLLCLIVCLLTELISNPATCSILMPVVSAMALELDLNPLFLMFPVVTCCSFAFMLPVASPQNALVFSTGRFTVIDMMKAGAVLNVLCIFSVTLATMTYGYAWFDFGTIPWAVQKNTSESLVNGTYLL